MSEPSCHRCGGPIEIGKPVAIYHEECDRQQNDDREALVRMGELLQTGGMSDGFFLLGQVQAMKEEYNRLRALHEHDG